MNKLFFILFCVMFLAACQSINNQQRVDYLIVGGLVFTGDAPPTNKVSIGICDAVICFIGEHTGHVRPTRVVDASGFIVTPGFIDPHTHTLEELLSGDNNGNINYTSQGVTTVITGNDGDGDFEIKALKANLERNGIGTNVGLLVGHNALRFSVMGNVDRPADSKEMETMKSHLRKALNEGALGFSTGLYYVPGSYSTTEEVVELTKIAAEFGVLYESHIRDESTFSIGFLAAVEEFIQIIKATGVDGHIAHIKALGVDVWGQSKHAVQLINAANESGLNITADQYPWMASGTFLHNAVFPKWLLEGSKEKTLNRLQDNAKSQQMSEEIKENIRKRGGPDTLLITASKNPEWQGKYLSDIASNNQITPEAMAVKMFLEEETRVASFNMNQDDLVAFMTQDWVVTSSDGTNGHPRKYASFPKKYQTYVAKKGVLSLEQFIERSSVKTAEIFKIPKRGLIKQGYFADINVIDKNNYKPQADFSEWNRLSSGVVHQFINGMPSIVDSKPQSTLNGQVILNQKRATQNSTD